MEEVTTTQPKPELTKTKQYQSAVSVLNLCKKLENQFKEKYLKKGKPWKINFFDELIASELETHEKLFEVVSDLKKNEPGLHIDHF